MTAQQKVIWAKVGLLELAKQLDNLSPACRVIGYCRDRLYCFRELYDNGGEVSLQEVSRRRPVVRKLVRPKLSKPSASSL